MNNEINIKEHKNMVNLELIRNLRLEKGLKAKDIAEYLGIGHKAYYHKLNGIRRFSVEEVVKLSDLYGCAVDELVIKEHKGVWN